MSQHALALPLCEEVTNGRKKTLGITHERTLESMANVATVQMRLGQHVLASEIFSEALATAVSDACFKGKPKSKEACVKQLSELAARNATLQTDPTAAAAYQRQLASASAQQSVKVDAAKAVSIFCI